MIKIKKGLLSILSLLAITSSAQDKSAARALPAVDLKDVTGTTINTSTFDNGGKPIIVDFWATWCKTWIE